MRSARLLPVVAVLMACGSAPPERRPVAEPFGPTEEELAAAEESFGEFSEEFLAWYHAAHPVRSTEIGLHEHDGRLPDRGRQAIQNRIDELLEWLRRLEDIDPMLLEVESLVDFQLLESAIRAELLDLEEVRTWTHNPRFYHAPIARGVEPLVTGGFAPADARIRNLVARLEDVPDILASARENLSRVPRLWAELGVAEARATATYLRGPALAALLEQAGDGIRPMLRGQLEAAVDRAATALEEYAGWLAGDVVAAAGADFRLGRYIFLRKLLYEEHVRLEAEELVRISEQTIQRLHEELVETAADLDPDRTPRAILDSLARAEETPEALLSAIRDRIREAREFVETRELLTLPDAELPAIRAAPGHIRGERLTLQMPGPFDTTGTAVLNATISPDTTTGTVHGPRLGPGELAMAAVHHVMPGHFVQKTYVAGLSSAARRTFQPRSLAEGWAHYAEQLLVEEGFEDDDPIVRLAQLRRALERHARWDAGLHMHAFGETVDQAARRFQSIAYVDEATARREVVRGTYDPIYLSDALGRMQLLELRRAYRQHLEEKREEEGDRTETPEFTLRHFHDRYLELGLPPTLARPILMPQPRERAPERPGRRRRVFIPPH